MSSGQTFSNDRISSTSSTPSWMTCAEGNSFHLGAASEAAAEWTFSFLSSSAKEIVSTLKFEKITDKTPSNVEFYV